MEEREKRGSEEERNTEREILLPFQVHWPNACNSNGCYARINEDLLVKKPNMRSKGQLTGKGYVAGEGWFSENIACAMAIED